MTETLQVYLNVLNDEGEKYPPKFFTEGTKKQKTREIISYILEKEGISDNKKAKEVLTQDFIVSHKLLAVVKNTDRVPELLPTDHSDLFWYIYPDQKPSQEVLIKQLVLDIANGQRQGFPTKYFYGVGAKEKAQLAFRFLCEDVLDIDMKQTYDIFSRSEGVKVFAKYKFKVILQCVYPSTTQLMFATYPDILEYQNDDEDDAFDFQEESDSSGTKE